MLAGTARYRILALLFAALIMIASAGIALARPVHAASSHSPRKPDRQIALDSPRAASTDPLTLLAQISNSGSMGGPGNYSAVQVVFQMSTTMMADDGQYWDLGDGMNLNSTGITNFTATADPDLPHIATMLTDGYNEFIWLWTNLPGGGGSGTGSTESYFLGKNPDLVGFAVDFVRLNVTGFSIINSGGYVTINVAYVWEFWGHPLFLYFVPPTDPDGAYLVDRNTTTVSVGLAGPGTATLEWDGVNESMAPSGSNRSRAVPNLANGVHSYRVWAVNGTRVPFVTPMRQLTIGVGIWTIEHVGRGDWPSVAFNASGEPRVCYYGGGNLVYAERTGSGWANTTVTGASGPCSLAVDSKGRPHISYLGGYSPFTINYATFDGHAWSTTTVDSGYYTPTSIAINPVTDNPMIAYTNIGVQGLKLATLSGSTWNVQVVDPSFYGQGASLAIDSSGRPAIAYLDWPLGMLHVARWTGSSWNFTALESEVYAASIAFDAAGVPHVAYGTYVGLRYATWNGTGWSVESLDTGRFYSTSLSFDSLGRPHIGYAMSYGGDVREAMKDGTWAITVITHRSGGEAVTLEARVGGFAGAAFLLNDTPGDLVFATDFRDTTPPRTVASLNGTAGNGGWFRSNVTMTLQASDDWSGVRSTQVNIDGGGWMAYAGAILLKTDGHHTVQYRSTDGAGNVESVETTDVYVDRTPPTEGSGVSAPPNTAGWYNAPVTVNLSAADATSGVSSIGYRLDGGNWTTYAAPIILNSDGRHTIDFFAVDVAGNSASAERIAIDVDQTAPTLSIEPPPAFVTSTYLTVHWTANDSLSGIVAFQVSVDGAPFQATGTVPFVNLVLADGAHTVTVQATDAAGNRASSDVRFTVDTNVFSFTGPQQGLPTILFIVGVVAGGLVVFLWMRRKNRPAESAPPPDPPRQG